MAVLIFFLTIAASYAEHEDFTFKVRDVSFSGVAEFEKKTVASLLTVQSVPFWKFWLSQPVVSIADVEEDVLKIKQHYQAQGYYQCEVKYRLKLVSHWKLAGIHENKGSVKAPNTSTENQTANKNEMLDEYDVKFEVRQGPPIILRKITLEGLTKTEKISEQELRNKLLLKIGKIFTAKDYEDSKGIVKKFLGNKGYPFAEIKGRALVDINDNSAEITYDITPGMTYYFGKIHISGYEGFLNPDVIYRAMSFHPGDKYDLDKLDESRKNLYDLNVFKTALVQTGTPDEEGKVLPIEIQVKPRNRQSVQFGAGYGTEDGLRVQGGWGYRNLTGNADRISITAKHSEIKEDIQGEYQYPYFLSSRNNLIVQSGFDREKTDFYTLRYTFTNLNVHRKITDQWTSTVGYNLEANRPENVKVGPVQTTQDIINQKDYRVSSAKLDVEYNTVADELNPKSGTVLDFSFEDASDRIWSEISYIKPMTEAKVYIPMPLSCVLAGRARFITIQGVEGTDAIPIYKQLFLGGSKTVRGYDYQKLGVVDDHGVLISDGGQSSFLGNVELRFPLPIINDFSGVAFLDSGVMGSDAFQVPFNDMRYTTGLGLRYDTVIEPIQLDVGYKLNPPKTSTVPEPNVIGGADTALWHFYLNIGQAF